MGNKKRARAAVLAAEAAKKAEVFLPDITYVSDILETAQVTTFAQQVGYQISKHNIPNIWLDTQGEGITIAVLDTGVDPDHPDLTGSIVGTWNAIKNQDRVEDRSGHGTHCTGIITANNNDIGMVGVAPQAKILTVKVLGDDGSGSYAGIATGIRYAIQQKVDIISMSLGGPAGPEDFHTAVKEAYNANIPVICAAGNCLSKGTRIKTGEGWQNIEDIQSGDTVYSFDIENRKMKLQKVTNTFARTETVYKVRTFTRSVQCTANHMFLCATSKSGSHSTPVASDSNEKFLAAKTTKDQYFYEWKKLEAIVAGDLILIDKNSDNEKSSENSNLDIDELYLYGVMLGDGWVTVKRDISGSPRCRFGIASPMNSPHTDYLMELSEDLFGKKLSQSKYELNLYSHKITRDWAEKFPNLANQNSHTKRVEPWVFNLSISQKISVIQGYFDSDGTVHDGNLTFESCNRNLIQDIYELCIRSGIKNTNICTRSRETNFGHITSFLFSINNYDSVHSISSRHPYKKNKLKKMPHNKGHRNYGYKVNKIIEQENVAFDRIQSIEEIGIDEVFDIEVPMFSNFVANNIIVHNSGDLGVISFPARYTETISVGALNDANLRAEFSETGVKLDFMAPGVEIFSTYAKGKYRVLSGTSMATPWVAGVVALMMSKHRKVGGGTPLTSVEDVREHLKKTAIDLDVAGKDPKTGYGLIDVSKALENIAPEPTPKPDTDPIPTPDPEPTDLSVRVDRLEQIVSGLVTDVEMLKGQVSSVESKLNQTKKIL